MYARPGLANSIEYLKDSPPRRDNFRHHFAMPEEDQPTAHEPGEQEVCLRVGHHLRQLAERLDPPSFELLLKVMSGINLAFAQRNRHVDVDLTPAERELYTPQLQQELVTLLELARLPRDSIVTGPLTPDDAAEPAAGCPPRDRS